MVPIGTENPPTLVRRTSLNAATSIRWTLALVTSTATTLPPRQSPTRLATCAPSSGPDRGGVVSDGASQAEWLRIARTIANRARDGGLLPGAAPVASVHRDATVATDPASPPRRAGTRTADPQREATQR